MIGYVCNDLCPNMALVLRRRLILQVLGPFSDLDKRIKNSDY
jgi:hypothetical protein